MDINHIVSVYGNLLEVILYIVLSVLLYIKTKDIKYLKELYVNFMNNENIVMNSADKNTVHNKQSFESLVPVYKMNKRTNVLEKTDEFVDLQEVLNSYKDSCYNELLSKFLPEVTETNTVFDAAKSVQDDLDFMQESFDIAEEYRSKLGLSETLSPLEVFKVIKDYKGSLDLRIKEIEQNEKKKDEQKG